ncbi:MAG: NAD(P)/FAD-dependent oxidoreductase, partial [Bacteroidota bacterium]|nr:NAD(P)/FAD-dependent oxidoreductase [Bacteroidota bacterium]
MEKPVDVIIVGAGHNGLVSAILLARAGLRVKVLEEKDTVGGAAKTEYPFTKVPNLGTSTGAYLLGVMPPELIKTLGIDLPLMLRDPHYFLPTTGKRYLLFGSDKDAMRKQFISFFSEDDWRANQAMSEEIEKIRDDIAPTWLEEPYSIEETAERYVRPELKQIFIDLCRKPVGEYINRFGFKSDLVKAMYAVTDGFSGLFGSWDTRGSGMNFLVHNMCRLPGSDGTWMVVKGGMGTVTKTFSDAARKAGAEIITGKKISSIDVHNGVATGVTLADGSQVKAKVVVVNADPFRMQTLIGVDHLPAYYNARIENYKRPGSTFKVNLALKGLPKFTCLPEDHGQYGSTIHMLPDEEVVMQSLEEGFNAVREGRLYPFPTIEWYIHTTVD